MPVTLWAHTPHLNKESEQTPRTRHERICRWKSTIRSREKLAPEGHSKQHKSEEGAEGQERVYLTAHLGHLQGVQKPRVCSAHDFAFRFLILFFIFNLERKKKVYGEEKRNCATSGALVFAR